MRLRRIIAAVLCAGAAAAAAAAQAPVAAAHSPMASASQALATASQAGRPWPRGTITYFNAAPRFAKEVSAAVSYWNKSGIRVRFKRVARSRAQVLVRAIGGGRGCHGFATLGYARGYRGHAVSLGLADCDPDSALWVAAHEFGHIIGLPHAQRRCAVMSTPPLMRCKAPPHPWQRHCRVLQAHDLAAGRRLYGGRKRPAGPQFCDRWKIPAPPTAGALHLGEVPEIEWRSPTGAVATVLVSSGPTCAAARTAADAHAGSAVEAQPGKVQRLKVPYGAKGAVCFVLRAQDTYGRFQGELTIEGVVPNRPPVASFTLAHEGPGEVSFQAAASDPDGQIVSWAWDFGDGTRDDGAYPYHRYERSGTYLVRLVVTDDSGATAASEQQVVVTLPDPPVAAFTYTTSGSTVSFDAGGSAANGGEIESYDWDFGDYDYGYGATTQHTYWEPGTYTVTLTIRTTDGRTDTVEQTVSVTS